MVYIWKGFIREPFVFKDDITPREHFRHLPAAGACPASCFIKYHNKHVNFSPHSCCVCIFLSSLFFCCACHSFALLSSLFTHGIIGMCVYRIPNSLGTVTAKEIVRAYICVCLYSATQGSSPQRYPSASPSPYISERPQRCHRVTTFFLSDNERFLRGVVRSSEALWVCTKCR